MKRADFGAGVVYPHCPGILITESFARAPNGPCASCPNTILGLQSSIIAKLGCCHQGVSKVRALAIQPVEKTCRALCGFSRTRQIRKRAKTLCASIYGP